MMESNTTQGFWDRLKNLPQVPVKERNPHPWVTWALVEQTLWGYTDRQIAKMYDVGINTWQKWKRSNRFKEIRKDLLEVTNDIPKVAEIVARNGSLDRMGRIERIAHSAYEAKDYSTALRAEKILLEVAGLPKLQERVGADEPQQISYHFTHINLPRAFEIAPELLEADYRVVTDSSVTT